MVSLFINSACKQNITKKSLFINDLKYAVYTWRLKEDSFQFCLVRYINIHKDGQFIGVINEWSMVKPQYFKGLISDALHNQIDSIFRSTYQQKYPYPGGGLYCGYFYRIDYIDQNFEKKSIDFIPNYSPRAIQVLQLSLDTLTHSRTTIKVDSIDIEDYNNELRDSAVKIHSPIPKLKKAKIINIEKFNPSKYRK